MMRYMDWPLVESRASFREWSELQREKSNMDTDALLLSAQNAETSHEGLMKVIEANTAAWKEVRGDLAKCNNQDKVNAVIVKVEKAFTDLSIESQKIPQWMKDVRRGSAPTPPYGQYPINQPIHPYNPVPWPPDYTPPS